MAQYQTSTLYSSDDLQGIVEQLKTNGNDDNVLVCIYVNPNDINVGSTTVGSYSAIKKLVNDSSEFKSFMASHDYYFVYEYSETESQNDMASDSLCRKLEAMAGLNSEKVYTTERKKTLDFVTIRHSGSFVFNIANGEIKKKCHICNGESTYRLTHKGQALCDSNSWNLLTEEQQGTWMDLGVFPSMDKSVYFFFSTFADVYTQKTDYDMCCVIENTVRWKLLGQTPEYRTWYWRSEDIIQSILYAKENNIPVVIGEGLTTCSICIGVYDYDVITISTNSNGYVKKRCDVESIDFTGSGSFNNSTVGEYLSDKNYIFVFSLENRSTKQGSDIFTWYDSVVGGLWQLFLEHKSCIGRVQTYWYKKNGETVNNFTYINGKTPEYIIDVLKNDFSGYVQEDIVFYTVVFQDYDGTVLKTETVKKGNDATPPEEPTRVNYIFTEWSPSCTNVQSDLTVIAQYTVNKNDPPPQQETEEEEETEEQEQQVDYQDLSTTVIPIDSFGMETTSHTYQDYLEHKLRMSSNVIGINVYSSEDD